jgi:hypothetical protein
MAKIELTPGKLILREGSTILTLEKNSGKATLQQKVLLWSKKPVEFAIADIDDIAVKSDKDGLSGASIYHSVLHRKTGEITVLTTEEAKDADETVKNCENLWASELWTPSQLQLDSSPKRRRLFAGVILSFGR